MIVKLSNNQINSIGNIFSIINQFYSYFLTNIIVMNVKTMNIKSKIDENDVLKEKKGKVITRQAARKATIDNDAPDKVIKQQNIKIAKSNTNTTNTKKTKQRKKEIANTPEECYYTQIMKRIHQLQNEQRIDQNYIKYHKTLNSKMRVFLVKYLYRIYNKCRLRKTTLFLAIYYMDWYFQSNMNLNQQQLFLTAQSALHIAMKYQEIYPPSIKQWAGQKNIIPIINHQAQILNKVNYKLSHYTLQHFLQLHCSRYNYSNKQQYLLNLLVDLTLFDEKMYQYKPSVCINYLIKIVRQQESEIDRAFTNIKSIIYVNASNIQFLRDFKSHQFSGEDISSLLSNQEEQKQ